ncbi:MAG: hypothetical protein M1823_002469, partial [Watsoniomyces obsoletus]
NLLLVQMCVTRETGYQRGQLSIFWKNIAGLFMDKTGKHLKDPRRTVEKLVEQRKLKIKLQQTQSGMLQEATELSNALDCWLVRLQDYDDVQETRRENQVVAQQEKADTQRATDSLLVSLGRRKRPRLEEDSEHGDSTRESIPSGPASRTPSRAPRRRYNRSSNGSPRCGPIDYTQQFDNVSSSMGNMADAIRGLAKATQGTVLPVEKRLDSLEEKVDKRLERLEELIGTLAARPREQ